LFIYVDLESYYATFEEKEVDIEYYTNENDVGEKGIVKVEEFQHYEEEFEEFDIIEIQQNNTNNVDDDDEDGFDGVIEFNK